MAKEEHVYESGVIAYYRPMEVDMLALDGEQQTNNQMEELTMTTTTTTTIMDQASKVIENIKAGKSAAATTTTGIKEYISSVWAAVKGYDYKGAVSKAWAAVGNAYDKVDIWFTTTKLGRTTSYVAAATTAMTLVGFFLSPVPTVLLGAALYTGYNAYCAESFTAVDVAKAFVVNALLFATIATVAYFAMPYVALAFTYLYYAGILALLIPGAAILF